MSFQKIYGFGGVGLSEVQLSISELSVVGGWWTGQTHFMVGPSQGPTKNHGEKGRIFIKLQILGAIMSNEQLKYIL